jgi:zinc carboxypeptidase
MDFDALFNEYKEASLYGRYITLADIEPLLEKYDTEEQLSVIGHSVLGKPIYSCDIGYGTTKILLWSQMHGNESTTTKALFDLMAYLDGNSETAKELLQNFTFRCIPMLNPDGAALYTRENFNKADLNRDAFHLLQPESRALRAAFDSFKPDYCYNLHDQRTIFGAGDTGKPATVSFLAPAYNENRDTNEVRAKAMHVIAAMNNELQQYIPGQIGRFDDSFNNYCVGDTFQYLNVPTILFEAGHFPNDYQREQTRKFIFIALIAGLRHIHENVIVSNEIHEYLNIPQNKVIFYDFVYKNIKVNYDSNKIITNFALQYREELVEGKICFVACFAEIGSLDNYFGHFEYDAAGGEYSDDTDNIPKLNEKADFWLDKNIKIVNGRINS